MTNQEAVWVFLNGLKSQRDTYRHLLSLASQNPDAVLSYLETLPEGWKNIDSQEKDLLVRLERIAHQSLT